MRFAICCVLLLPSVRAQTPAPLGRLVDAGGYRVHLYCTGQGSPTVFIAGAGFSFDWGLVQPEVAKFTRVCSYDVSGTAWSDAGPSKTCTERVAEIHAVLRSAGVGPPYVLVGLSFGALVTRWYASQHANEVAGMVIVDHAFLHPVDPPPQRSPKPANSNGITPPVLIHQEPIVLTAEDTAHFERLPERNRMLHHWAASLHPALPTAEEAETCLAQVEAAEKRQDPLGDMPLVVVSTGNVLPNYRKLQTTLLALSHKSSQFIADESFHSVEIDQPDVVVSAIRQVVAAIRTTR